MTPIWNPSKRQLVCPHNTYYSDKEGTKLLLWQLERLDCKLVKEIKMPIEMWHKFYLVKVPKFLTLEENEDGEGGVYSFKDEKGRARLRVTAMQMFFATHVWTRYLPQHEFTRNGSPVFVPCVIDTEKSDEFDEVKAVMWKGKKGDEMLLLYEREGKAAEWLNKNYPDWKDPLAYWSK
jgi:hypothetical protein